MWNCWSRRRARINETDRLLDQLHHPVQPDELTRILARMQAAVQVDVPEPPRG